MALATVTAFAIGIALEPAIGVGRGIQAIVVIALLGMLLPLDAFVQRRWTLQARAWLHVLGAPQQPLDRLLAARRKGVLSVKDLHARLISEAPGWAGKDPADIELGDLSPDHRVGRAGAASIGAGTLRQQR